MASSRPVVLAFVALLLICAQRAAGLVACNDESGQPVDWWVIYKLPALKTNQSNPFASGYRYGYMDANSPTKLALGKDSLDTFLTGALGSTLNQIYKNRSTGYIMWNDETPDGRTTSSRGHTKGVMGFTTDGGFLLRHSVPRFPAYRKDGYKGYPEFAHLFGQTMICVSVKLDTLNVLASQYLINAPFVYDALVPTSIAAHFANISMMAQGMTAHARSSAVAYQSRGGQTFYDFAKSKGCQCELYSDVVAPEFKSDLRTLTWGRPLMESFCKPKHPYDVTNIMGLKWTDADLQYKETKEHSKWAISMDNKPWACIGDINRMSSQGDRGGGTTCFNNPGLWKSLNTLIDSEDSCKIPQI